MSILTKLSVAASMLVFSSVASFAQTVSQDMKPLYDAAKAEGEVRFGGTLAENEIGAVLKAFEEKYPGIKISYTRRSTGPMVQLMEAERRANRTSFDLVNLSEPDAFLRWKEQKYIAKLDGMAEVAQMLPETADKDGYFFAIGVTPMIGVYNSSKIKPEDAPKSLKDLKDPRWRGTLAMSRPTRGGTNASALMNVAEENGIDFIRQAGDLKILITNGNEAALSAIISGERTLGWGVTGYRLVQPLKEGAPIKLIWWPEGSALAQYPTGVTAQAKNPNAAKLLLRYLLSPEGQTLMVKNLGVHSSRSDVSIAPEGLPKLSDIKVKFYGADRISAEGDNVVLEFDKALGLR